MKKKKIPEDRGDFKGIKVKRREKWGREREIDGILFPFETEKMENGLREVYFLTLRQQKLRVKQTIYTQRKTLRWQCCAIEPFRLPETQNPARIPASNLTSLTFKKTQNVPSALIPLQETHTLFT